MNLSGSSSAVSHLLRRHGWVVFRAGQAADLWSFNSTHRSLEMYVPREMRLGSFEWSDVIRRIAEAADSTVEALASEIELGQYDVSRFRVDNDSIQANTIPLEAGITVVSSAFSMLRAAATTARRPRQSIGGGYSKIGDELVQQARLGHTEAGSFIFPVLLRVDEAPMDTEAPLPTTEHVQPESAQRRIVRTLAQSLATYKTRVIDPGKEPRRVDLLPIIAAGGSKELFTQVYRILDEPSVGRLETKFTWAFTETTPENVPSHVTIPSEARELVRKTVELMTEPEPSPLQIVTGPIIDIGHVPGDPFGQITVQTASVNNQRVGKVEMRVRERELSQIHLWMDTATTVVVRGVVERARGKTPRLREVASPRRLDDTFFDFAEN